MLPQPLGHSVGRTTREERDGLAVLQINQHRAIDLAFAQRKIVHPQHPRRGQAGQWLLAQSAQQGVPAHREVPRVAEAYPGCTTQRHAKSYEALGEPEGAPRPGGRHGGQPFSEDAAVTRAIAAKPFADAELEVHPILRPGQVCQGAPIVTMDAPRWGGAQRTGRAGLGRAHAQNDLCRGVIDGTGLEAQRGGIRQQTRQDGGGWCRDESGLLLPSRMSLGQRRVCVPTASGWSCVSKEIYKVEQRKIPRYSRVLYHQKGTRTPMWAASSNVCGPAGLRLWVATVSGVWLAHQHRIH